MELHELATPVAYVAATILAIGFWIAFNIQSLLKRQVSIQALLLLVTVLAMSWAIARYGMG